ncbi:ATPase involved in DNA repair [uncultured Roseburia sp.]|uniref:Ig-like domain-containing protein n=1 Tax=Brotonthovivens ammoniilytica TaxID=2981725 RepID=A0ABT2TKJ8_9FIRM|nr:Ig-like domain-containing protein [Brotonthovivens ammoniilytica]MCU6762627.1 Ig-like domain-containing protein [Brotonthovivens ammoniilytica]SCI77817.1 ATPase involved in DNA repair [uncultured Roseburia sp.]
MKRKAAGKLFSFLTAAVMGVSMIPATALAAETKSTDVDQEWYNFRNNQENNGVTDRPTPTSDLEAAQKWAVKYGSGWSAAPTPPLILDDYLYIGVGNKIIKIDKATGEKVDESDEMAGNVGYAMNPILYADGKLFVQIGSGRIQAVDYDTLTCAWTTEAVDSGQTVSPISYAEIDGEGYIYTGTWTAESRDGTFFCVSTDDDGVVNGVKEPEWKFVPSGSTKDTDTITYDPDLNATLDDEGSVAKRGFYWAGAYATDKYVAVGSDDGTGENDPTANGVFYTLNPKTGEIIDKISGIKGDIRTTVVYDNGHLYFCTKGGLMYKVDVDASGNLSNESYMDLGNQVTAAPIVYKNKIYVGVRGDGGQFDPDGGHFFAVIDNSGTLSADSLMYKLPIAGYPQAAALLSTANEDVDYDQDGKADGRVYLYFTYNAQPGGIYYTYDTPDQKEASKESKELFVPDEAQQQYCISTICADREGTLYYKNDSGYLMAVEANEAYLNNAVVTSEDGTTAAWDKAFDSRKSNYEVKLPTGSKQAVIKLDLIEGSSAAVNGTAYKNQAVVALGEDGTAEAAVTITKGEDSRTYTLKIACQSENADLSGLEVNNSNSAGDGIVDLSPEFASGNTEYTADITELNGIGTSEFWNVWPTAADNSSSVTVYPVENVDEDWLLEDGTVEGITRNGTTRYPVYPKDPSKTIKVRIDVTSENGKVTKSYHLTLLKKVDVTGVALNHTEYTMDLKDTLQLQAEITPADATYQTVKWYSSDEEVAVVDENGLVTPKKAGKTTITVITDDKSLTAACEVTVENRDLLAAQAVDDKIDAIGEVTLESKADIDVARAAYDALTDDQKALVTKYDTLTAAEKTYQELKDAADKEAADTAAAKAVDDKISAIGEVTLESKDAIEDARTAYDALTDDQKALVTNLADLEKAEEAYGVLALAQAKEDAKAEIENYKDMEDYRQAQQEELKEIIKEAQAVIDEAKDQDAVAQAAADAKAKMDQVKTDAQLAEDEIAAAEAKAVMDKIDGIGEVTLKSKTEINAARIAYDGLSDLAKSKVTNYEKLTAAESKYAALVKEQKPETVVDKESGISVEGKLIPDSKLVIEELKEADAPELLKAFESEDIAEILGAYEVSLENGGFNGSLKLIFTVGDEYNGRKVIIKHLTGDGSIDTYTEIVKDGKVSVTVDSLSPFMLALADDNSTADPGKTPGTDNQTNQTDTNGNNTDQDGKTENPDTSISPKTGDEQTPMFWTLFICAAGAGILVIARAKYRKETR